MSGATEHVLQCVCILGFLRTLAAAVLTERSEWYVLCVSRTAARRLVL